MVKTASITSTGSSWIFTSLQLIVAALAYTLVTLPWEREISYGFKRIEGNTSISTAMDEAAYTRSTVYFSSVGDKLEGTARIQGGVLVAVPQDVGF